MPDSFIIRLPRSADLDASWIAVDPLGNTLGTPRVGTLADAAADIKGRKTTVLVPSADVLLTAADLPAKASGAKLAQIVQYALEEQLADDIDTLHFALAKRAGGMRTPVAVVDRRVMTEWLAALDAAGIAAESMYSDAQLVAENPGQTVVWIEGDTLVVRAPESAPANVPLDDLRRALEMAAVPAGASLLIFAPAPDWERHAGSLSWLQEHFAIVRVQLLPQGSLPWLATQIAATSPINLLQGTYAPKRGAAPALRQWRVAAALAAALLVLHVGGRALEVRRLAATERALDAEIDQVFRSAMPGALDSSNARKRMEQRALSLGQSGSGGELLPALSQLATASANAPGAAVQTMSFRDGSLELKMRAPDADSLDRINRELRTSGLAADITGGAAVEGAYEGRIRIKMAGQG